MRIIIDKRERDLYQKCNEYMESYENKQNITLLEENLDIGDILIQTDDEKTVLIIERKSFQDLLASIKDGRYEEQSHRLIHTSQTHPHSIIYLLEGMFSQLSNQKDKKIIYSSITSLNCFKGFSIMRTSTIQETREWLILLTEKINRELEKGKVFYYSQQNNRIDLDTKPEPELQVEQKENTINYCNFVKKVKRENITPENIGEIVLSQIPGISSITAIAIMKKFSSFLNLLEELKIKPDCLNDITTETNGKIRKISKSSIENIKKFFL
jgi:crossover junction endonuclease MUS81